MRPNWGARLRAAENTRTGGRPGDKTANMQPIKRIIILLLGSLLPLASSCTHDVWSDSGLPETPSGALFRLCGAEYDDAESRSGLREGGYDRVEFCVVDASGEAVPNLKGRYDSATSELRIEGLHEGDYRLLVLGIRGDAAADGVTVRPIRHLDEEWLTFPETLDSPLAAEYFYSQTPFEVVVHEGADGHTEEVILAGEVVQRRIVGRVDFSLSFRNPYVGAAFVSSQVAIEPCRIRTGLTGGGELTGEGTVQLRTLAPGRETAWLLPPTVGDTGLQGEVEVRTRSYLGADVSRRFAFDLPAVEPNRIARLRTEVVHPDDESATLFLTEEAYAAGRHGLILQDDEPKEVYTDPAQRRFNTAAPLQVAATDAGELHVRFYSPRELTGVLIRARIPAVDAELLDVAWFDRIPAFADFRATLPFTERACMARTESGRWVRIPRLEPAALDGIEFRIESEDPYWEKLCAIRHGWTIAFSLFGGDPEREDGGPSGNWMGIRPVHCREVVALFLNFTYMIDMPEHEEILRANEDRLYGNGGVNDKVTAETVLRQMQQSRTLNVGLVYPGNGIVGLGGGSTFGAYQQAWLQHYFNTYSCEIMFHELGHVMGYSHSSSFTYGPWAQELMNRFYVEHISQMPIDSPHYLNSSTNPNLYK